MRLFPGILVILALLVVAPSAYGATVTLTQPSDGATLPVVGDALAQISYAATLQRAPLECATGDWSIQRRRNGGEWTKVIGAPSLVPALATSELRPAGRYDVRARLNCPGEDPVFSAINTVRVVVESLPDPGDVPLPDPGDVPLPDPGDVLPDPGDIPLPTGDIPLPDGGTIPIPTDGLIPVDVANGVTLPGETAGGGQVIPLAPGTIDTKLCMVALSDVEAVRDLLRRARRKARRNPSARNRARVARARDLMVQARAAESESCL